MLNLKRGFRRLFLVLSVVWVGSTGVYLWRAPRSLNTYQVELSDGRTFLVEATATPSRTDLERYLDSNPPPLERAYVDPDDGKLIPSPPPGFKLAFDERGKPRYLEKLPPIDLRRWLVIGLVPPMIALALLESLLWAARGFLGDKAR